MLTSMDLGMCAVVSMVGYVYGVSRVYPGRVGITGESGLSVSTPLSLAHPVRLYLILSYPVLTAQSQTPQCRPVPYMA